MENIKKILSLVLIIILLLTPCYTYAEPEGEITSPPATENNGENNNNQEETEESGKEETKPEEGETGVENKPQETQKTIKLDKNELELGINQETTLKATVTPSDTTIEWTSDKEDIATVDQNGKVTTKKTAGTAKITATIKGTKINATCTIKVTRTIGKDATLKSLTIKNGKLDRTFKSNIFEYSVTVDSTVNSLIFTDLQADLNDPNAGYMVPSASNKNLKNGSIVRIVVTAEDEETQNEYKLTIIKDTVNLNLKSLKINGYALNEIFNKNTLEYTATIPYEIETISVIATPEDSNVEVKTSGLTNLKVGENTVTVTVKDLSGNSKIYKIFVTRDKEEKVEENPTSIITSSVINNNNETNTDNKNNNESNNSDNFLKYAIVSIACLILFVIGGIGIYFYLKTSPKRLKKELNNLKAEGEASPIIEVDSKNNNQVNVEEIMNEDLIQTKEFKKEELEEISKTEDLFDNSEDV